MKKDLIVSQTGAVTKKRVAPAKSTGGGGYDFEDKVGAHFLLCMLSDQPPLTVDKGLITRVSFQNNVDGWLIDDIHLELVINSQKSSCAISVKSNAQFNTKGAPQDFVSTIWLQHLEQNPQVFDITNDILSIATNTIPSTISNALEQLKKKIQTNHDKLHKRINEPNFASKEERVLYASFDCPQDLAKKHSVTAEKKDSLLQTFRNFEFDFDNNNSRSEKDAYRLAESILEDPTAEKAQLLWSLLQQITKELRSSAGNITRNQLLKKIGNKFAFKLSPKFESDWDKLKTHSSQQRDNVRDTIGNDLRLSRSKQLEKIKELLKQNQPIIALGASGSGKTVLAKRWVELSPDNEFQIWVKAENFNTSTFVLFEKSFDLKSNLLDVLNSSMGKKISIVIDGLDRLFSSEGFENLSTFLKLINSSDLKHQISVLITCQPEEWGRCKTKLSDLGVNVLEWQLFTLNELEGNELEEVLKKFPTLRSLTRRKELNSLLYRPKVLDLLAKKSSDGTGIDVTKWIGESDLINWFWQNEIENSPNPLQKKNILKKIAELQGDKLATEISLDDLDPAYGTNIDSLVRQRLLKQEGEGFNFDHDSYGDWIRQRILLEKLEKGNLENYLSQRLSSPLWHRAIRLCSIHLIEQYPNLDKWRATIKTFHSENDSIIIAQDFFLEGVIISTDPESILEKLWSDLIDNKADFLHRLLGRFLHVATIPNPSMLEIGKQLGEQFETEAATIHRIPYWPYWMPILRFLYKHKEEVINLSPINLAKITDSWLRMLDFEGIPLRQEAAEMAMLNAEKVMQEKREGVHYLDDVDKPMFRAALAGYKEYPERLKTIIEEASGKVIVPKPIKKTPKIPPEKLRALTIIGSSFDDGDLMPPWPKGPKTRPDDSFEEVCLNTDAIYPIIRNDPKYASEIILTLLISPPTSRSYRWNRDPIMENLDFSRSREWYPPFYDKGPFLFFLRTKPIEGLQLIIDVVNFAADRWADRYKEARKRPPTLEIEIEGKKRKLFKDAGMYFWYRDYPPVPDVVASALIALEKWLYDLIDSEQSVDDYIKHILISTNNIAFLGLLSAVGRKKISLLSGVLKPLLSSFLFFIWEDDFIVQSDYWEITWSVRGNKAYDEAQKWYKMKHRSSSLTDYAKFLLLNQSELEDFFVENHKKWTNELKTKQLEVNRKISLLALLAALDKKNYHTEEKDGQQYWMLEYPAELKKQIEKRKELNEDKLLVSSLPMQSSYFLEKGANLTDDQAEEIWKNIQKIVSKEKLLAEKDRPDAIADAISAGIALLCKFKFDWVKKNQERYQWCLNYLTGLVVSPPPRAEFDSEHSVSKFHWDCFCSVALPYFWKDDLSSKRIRKCIALLVTAYHLTAVSNLFQTCSELRVVLGKDFKKLQHYLFKVAEAKSKYYETRYEEKPSFDLAAWIKTESDNFAEDKISSDLPKWSNNVVSYIEKYPSAGKRKKKHKAKAGLDTTLIKMGYQWLPLLREAKNPQERSEWISFLREALQHMLNSIGEESEEYEELDGVPSDWDYWVIHRVAIVSVEVERNESPETFWKPILELSGYAHYVVEHFLDDFFTYGPRLMNQEKFLETWHQMLNYAFLSPKWSLESKKYSSWTLGDFWWRLIGLDISRSEIDLDKQKELINKSEAFIEKWAGLYLVNHRCALKFIYFLSEPLGERLRLKGLIWLANSMNKLDSYYFWSRRGDSAEKALASLLTLCWVKNKPELKSNNEAFESFKHILNILVARQNNIAMELQDKISK